MYTYKLYHCVKKQIMKKKDPTGIVYVLNYYFLTKCEKYHQSPFERVKLQK